VEEDKNEFTVFETCLSIAPWSVCWLLPRDSADTAPGAGILQAPTLHENPEAILWELVYLPCTCGDL
jgi:hypothetical protein